MRGNSNKRLTILSDAEKTALYGIPSFDDFQRIEFFAMTDAERSLALLRRGILKQVYCLLQIGYFKAKQAFFQFSLDDVPPEDVAFLMQRYFPGNTLVVKPLSTREYYAQRQEIGALFEYRLWTDNDLPVLRDKATLLARTDVAPAFLLAELMVFLIGQHIVRPGYSTLQTIIRDALSAERDRLEQLVETAITDEARETLELLLANESTLSELAALKQDAKSFRYRQMGIERQKRLTLQRPEDPRRQRHPDRRHRWLEGHARSAGRGVPRHHAADVHRAPDPQQPGLRSWKDRKLLAISTVLL